MTVRSRAGGAAVLVGLPLAHSGSDRAAQLLRKPQFNERLSCYTEPARFSVEGVYHPSRKIHIYPLRIGPNAPRLAQIKLIHDFFTGIKLAVKCLGFHKSLPLRLATVSQRSVGRVHRAG